MPEPRAELPEILLSQLLRLLDQPAGTRARGVDALCAEHPPLAAAIRAEAESLVRAAGARTVPQPEQARSPAPRPARIGPYRILERIGTGGMGEVYKAARGEPAPQVVALKVVRPGMATEEILARFDRERRALAAMNHDAIAKVFDAGATERGEPYFVMEFIDGLPLTTYCDAHRLSVAARLQVFQQICAGVQHAHQRGVIHRDLKPGNVLVVREGDRHVPKILDFGLAKATNRDSVDPTFLTEQDRVMGTFEYMAPEQAAGQGEVLDLRADVYSLGVILYQLLAGALPFAPEDLRRVGREAALRLIREAEPNRPSVKLLAQRERATEVATLRQTSVEHLGRALRGDLDWVVMKALAKEPERRYESAAALADDVGRFLRREPVQAGPPSTGYRLRKFAERHRGPLLAGGLVLAAVVAGVAGVTVFWWEARARKREFDQLAGVVRYEHVLERERDLYPPWPERIEPMQRWLDEDAGPLLAMQPAIEAALRDLRKRAPESGLAGRGAFPTESEQFLHDTLTRLLRDLATFTANQHKGVEARLRWARRIEALTLAHPNARVGWAQARAAIAKADGIVASERYNTRPIDLQPQTGLVPIGMNPVTGLWEFYELRSSWDGVCDPASIEIPAHVRDGERAGTIATGEATGIVFVLLPGGAFTMGTQNADPNAPNFDPQRSDDEAMHDVTLAPFFLARHELTQAQWKRLSDGDTPSHYAPGETPGDGPSITWWNPVESVDWTSCQTLLWRHGLALPTEAQWEYGARAGSVTPWCCDPAQLSRHANVADATAQRVVGDDWKCEEWEDGHVVHAPVGSFLPNAFGLFDMHGNVWEWTRDGDADPAAVPRPGDGARGEPAETRLRVYRGGSFDSRADIARSARRSRNGPAMQYNGLGVRACRELTEGAAGSTR